MIERTIRSCVVEILEKHMTSKEAEEVTYYSESVSDAIDELTRVLELTIEHVERHGITW